MKKAITIFSVIFLITLLTACSPDFNGSRTGNDNQLIMEYTAFNTTDSQDLVVEAGDTIHTEIVIEDGQLSYKIQKMMMNLSLKVKVFSFQQTLMLR